MEFQFTYTPTMKDQLHAAIAHYQRQPAARVILLIAVALLVYAVVRYQVYGNVAVLYFHLILIGPMLFHVPQRFLLWLHLRGNPRWRVSQITTFSESGVRVEAAEFDGEVEWKLYDRFYETDKAFVLEINSRQYGFVPKTAFVSKEQADQFREFLRRKIIKQAY